MSMANLAGSPASTRADAVPLIHRLAGLKSVAEAQRDPLVAPLLPGYAFGQRLMAGLTPIERDGLLDFAIERPRGLSGWTLLLTVRGRGRLLDRSGEAELGEGDVVLVPAGAEHRYRRHEAAAAWWHRWVYFQPRPAWFPWLVWQGGGARAAVLRGQDEVFRTELERIFAEIGAWSIHADDFSTEMSLNLLERAILICSRSSQRVRHDDDQRLAEVCAFIVENIRRALTLTDIADHAHLSVSRLSHLFLKKYGESVMSWRDALRIQMACRFLRMTQAPIKQVAIEVGFADPLHFSKTFRRRTGRSPSEFRRRTDLLG